MNAGFDISERTAADEGSPVPTSGVRAARTEAATLSYRDAETLPGIDLGDDPRLAWCVELPDRLATLTTFELWTALDRGEIAAYARVWREGMECWTPAGEVAELACALVNLRRSTPLPEPAETAETAEATTDPAPQMPVALTPAPGETRETEAPPRARGPFWMGLGTAVAALAIAVAMATSAEGPVVEPAARAGGIAAPVMNGGKTEAPGAQPAIDVPAAWATSAPASKPRREEPGQRRLRRGAKSR